MERVSTRLTEAHDLFCERSLPMTCSQGIATLPPEILSMVFEFVVQDQQWKMAIDLFHVTKSWRDVAIGTPTLWRTIEVWGNQERLHTLLERSKSVLIDVRLHLPVDHDTQINLALSHDQSVVAVLACSVMWRSFTCNARAVLRSYNGHPLQELLTQINTPNLRHVSVPAIDDMTFPHLPALCSLDLSMFELLSSPDGSTRTIGLIGQLLHLSCNASPGR